MKPLAIIGYSGHAFIAIDIFASKEVPVKAYFEAKEKEYNPYQLSYKGIDSAKQIESIKEEMDFFIGIGDNTIRRKVYENLAVHIDAYINAIHDSAVIAKNVQLEKGIMVAANAVINPLAQIGTGVICNTGSIIEHECKVGDFAHISPGAVLCGNVEIGDNSFIGANTVVKHGIRIGKNVVVGAGSVVIRDIEDNQTVVGNPTRKI